MKSFLATSAACLLLLASAPVAEAQSRARRSAPQRRRAPASRKAPGSQIETTQKNAARIQLGTQIKNLTRFLYLYGRFSKDLELTGAQSQSSDVANQTRATLVNSLRDIRAGLEQLEGQFRTTPGLERASGLLAGVAQRTAEAEQRAAANQLDQAGRILVEVVSRLTDVLLEL